MKRTILSALALLALAAGCSRSQSPVADDLTYDSMRPKELLVTVLDAWKQRRAVDLRRRQPPIRFADDDWTGGWHLVEYEINEGGFPLRPFKNIKVALTLRDRQGNVLQKQATYQIVLHPGPSVLRTDTEPSILSVRP